MMHFLTLANDYGPLIVTCVSFIVAPIGGLAGIVACALPNRVLLGERRR